MGAFSHISDATLLSELQVRARCASVAEVAAEFGISTSHVYGILNGNAPITPSFRNHVLDQFRAEELALADRIEAELTRPSLLKEGG